MPRLARTILSSISVALLVPAVFAGQSEQISPIAGSNDSSGPLSIPALQDERDRLSLENQLRDEALRKELASQTAELQRIKVETDLARARADHAVAEKSAELQKARTEMEEINTRLALESAKLQGAMEKEMAELRAKRERAELESQVSLAEFTRKNNEFKSKEIEWNSRLAELRAKVNEHENELEAEAYVDAKAEYTKEPMQPNGDLLISDRRIGLNGPITAETADYICSRIDFFNNKDKEYPIFIVIDDSPGGSVMAGYKILKSMQSSAAPVYVVVKSYAASMAAAICTLSQKSYAYPNAIILHHQISNGIHGNLSAQRDGVKMLEQWWERLATPIAQKMGITLEQFTKQMYAHSSSGDWQEFADSAVKLKWVDAVVGRCRETALIKNPDRDPHGVYAIKASMQLSAPAAEKGSSGSRNSITLPRLNPADCYYLHNPDGFYRVE
jgi:ATP-dependent Clp protease, protease subunit